MKGEIQLGEFLGMTHSKLNMSDHTLLCPQLRGLKLPKNPIQRLEYLMKERELLIQIISYYQIEFKVMFNNS